jgi:hypothetical protein
VFENRVLKRIFGPRREEVVTGWRTLRYKEIHNLYALSNIIPVIKSVKVRCEGQVARMIKVRNACSVFVRKRGREKHLEDIGVDEIKTLERILEKVGGKVWTGCMWLTIGTSGGLL